MNNEQQNLQCMNEFQSRLEFSESQQHFHVSDGHREPNTYGWVTICESGDDFYLHGFCDYIQRKYKLDKKKPVSVRVIKNEFKFYEAVKVYVGLHERAGLASAAKAIVRLGAYLVRYAQRIKNCV